MTWTKIDDAFWCNPKVMAAGNEAAGAYVRMLAYCGQQLSDGHIPQDVARIIAKPALLRKLATHDFIEENGSGWVIPDYLEFNPSAEEVKQRRKARAAAGRLGGLASSKGSSE